MQDTEETVAETVVVFRKWKDNSGVIALFPEIAASRNGWFCESYERVGQHGGADYNGVIQASKPAKPDEYASLQRELTGRGYKLRIIRKAQPIHQERRMRDGWDRLMS